MPPRKRTTLRRPVPKDSAQPSQNEEASSSLENETACSLAVSDEVVMVMETSREPPRKKSNKPRQQPLHLTAQQQDDVIIWFQELEFLYDKGHADYKLTEKKSALWKQKAEELGVCDGPRLKSWMDSIRTQYDKLSKRPSGSGGRLSDRDKWILEKLSILSRHIYRIPNRGGVDLLTKTRKKHPDRMPDSEEVDDVDEFVDVEAPFPSVSPSLSTASGDTDTLAAGKKKKKTNREQSTAFLQRLEERIQQSSQMQEKLFDQMAAPTDPKVAERHHWAQWFSTAIPEIDDSLWTEFQAESLQLVNSFKARSKSLRSASVQPVSQERADYKTARSLQTLNYSSCPGGYLPMWQQQYQPPPPHAMFPIPPATLGRSRSVTETTTSATASMSS